MLLNRFVVKKTIQLETILPFIAIFFLVMTHLLNQKSVAAEPGIVLKGRIFEIFDQRRKVRLPNLKPLVPQMDTSKKSAVHTIHPGLKSFPAILRGEWNGSLTVQ
mgnify:CR=1 FL=1